MGGRRPWHERLAIQDLSESAPPQDPRDREGPDAVAESRARPVPDAEVFSGGGSGGASQGAEAAAEAVAGWELAAYLHREEEAVEAIVEGARVDFEGLERSFRRSRGLPAAGSPLAPG